MKNRILNSTRLTSTLLCLLFTLLADHTRATPTTNVLTFYPGSPVVYGTSITLTSTITPAGATGTVAFYDGANGLGTNPVVSGVATWSVNNLMVSGLAHSLTAVYSGDSTYSASTSSAVSVTITPATLTPIIMANKTYDATTNAYIAVPVTLSNILAGDANYVSLPTNGLAASFSTKVIGTNRPVTITGTMTLAGSRATNYAITASPLNVTANITNKVLTVNGLTANNKTYNGTTNATISGSAALQPQEPPGSGTATDGQPYQGDSYTLSGTATGAFSTKTVGTNKTVTISGLSLTGTDAANYSLSAPATTANIMSLALTVTGVTANNKTYDATTTATLAGTATIPGVISGDSVTLGTSYLALFATKNAGNGIAVTVTNYTISGADASNYTLNQPTGLTANISKVGTSCTVTSSLNPSPPGTNVTITATVTANPLPFTPDAPTGTWTIQTNSVSVSPTPTLVSNATGVAIGTFSAAAWNLGANTVLAYYSGDNNYKSPGPVYYTQTVQTATCSLTNRIVSVANNGGNSFTLTLLGTPQAQYYIVSSTNAALPLAQWTVVPGSTNTVTNSSGLWALTVTNHAPAFYRSRAMSVCP